MNVELFWRLALYGLCGGFITALFLLLGNAVENPQTLRRLQKIRFQNRIKRLADMLEKIGVASLVVGLFQHNDKGFWIGGTMLAISMILTRENAK